jgi:hypothetical protein
MDGTIVRRGRIFIGYVILEEDGQYWWQLETGECGESFDSIDLADADLFKRRQG